MRDKVAGRYGITLGYEKDKCSICGYMKEVRFIFDREKHLALGICDICANEKSNDTPENLINQYGEKIKNKTQVKILDKNEFIKSGFEVKEGNSPKSEENSAK